MDYDEVLENTEPFTDYLATSVDPDLLDWDYLDQLSDEDPDSENYRKIMRQMKIGGRYKKTYSRFRGYDDWD